MSIRMAYSSHHRTVLKNDVSSAIGPSTVIVPAEVDTEGRSKTPP